MVFQRSMLDWRRGWDQSAMGIYALCYIYIWNLFCNGFPEIYAWLEEGVGSICHEYVCIVLYVKLIWWSGVAWICVPLQGAQSALGICAFFYMWNLRSVVVFHRSMVNWRRGMGSVCIGFCAYFYMWNLVGVVVFQRSVVNWRWGGWGLSALVSVHTSIYVKLSQCSGLP